MTKQLVLKPEKCMGCRTCELVCSFRHNDQFNPTLAAVTVIDYEQQVVSIPVMCLQCEEACCLKVCPVHAISRDEAGAVVMDPKKCIVCKMCMHACPLGNISFSPLTRKVFKCDLCGGDPQCARFCASGAIGFLDPVSDLDRKKAVADSFRDVFGEEAAQ
jgi:Fe-S-cluster-containing hydrogenase component 2